MGRKKTFRNIAYGFLGQLISIAFGLIVPRLILLSYGSEANGLMSSVGQIFAYVALLEAGVGGASLQALYRPVGGDDRESISAIMAATDRYYKKTGVLYALAVVVLAFGYPLVVSNDLGYWTVFGVILFNGLGGAINYLFQGKYYILLQAEGKNYVQTNISTAVYVGSNLIKICLCLLGAGIVALQLGYFILNLLQMAYVLIYIRRHYQWLDLSVKPDYDAISQKNSVMVHQVSALVFGNTDSIILTFFRGLKIVSVYTLISSLITHVNSILSNVAGGMLFNLGQNFKNDREKFMRQYDAFELLHYGMMTFCLIMVYIFLNPFLALYTQGVTDISYVDPYLPTLFLLSYFLTWARVPSIYVVNNCAGHFRQTQWRSILESAINIVTSIIFVFKLGIYGVLIGTIIALLYRTNDMIIYSYKNILGKSLWQGYRRLVYNIIWIIAACYIGKRLLPTLDGYRLLVLWALVYGVIILFGTLLINYLFNRKTFIAGVKMVLNR